MPIYYFRHDADAQPRQFTSTYFIGYTDKQGQYLTGDAGYVAAIKAGYFRVVAYNFQTTPGWTACWPAPWRLLRTTGRGAAAQREGRSPLRLGQALAPGSPPPGAGHRPGLG